MELFFKYDLLRLRAYDSVNSKKNKIAILDTENYLALCFPAVKYFNYAVSKNNQTLTPEEFSGIREFYRSQNISSHKIINLNDNFELDVLERLNYRKKSTISKVGFGIGQTVLTARVPDVNFIVVDKGNLEEFTKTYLDAFEAEDRDIRDVCENFGGLLKTEGIELFIVKDNFKTVGVVVLYSTNHIYYLAGGAILPEYRDNHYHKAGITMRLQKSLQDKSMQSIISWAYKDGISHRNMKSLGMIDVAEFDVYESSD